MSPGYRFTFDPNAVAEAVLGNSAWAVLALTLHIELFTLMHYLQSIEPDEIPLSRYWRRERRHQLESAIPLAATQ